MCLPLSSVFLELVEMSGKVNGLVAMKLSRQKILFALQGLDVSPVRVQNTA